MENNVENKQSSRNDGNTMLAEGLLIPMVDFIIKETDKLEEVYGIANNPQTIHEARINFISSVSKYAKFLSKPLKIEMFMTCDENGNALSEPEPYERRKSYDEVSLEYDDKEVKDYKKAKERLLFENVEIYRNWKYNLYFFSKIEFAKYDFKTNQFIVNHPFDNVESIISLKPKLTKSALSAIFG